MILYMFITYDFITYTKNVNVNNRYKSSIDVLTHTGFNLFYFKQIRRYRHRR